MKVFINIVIAVGGLGFMILIDVMANPTVPINGSEFMSSGHAFIERMPQASAFTNNTDLSIPGQDAKKSPVRKASIKKSKKFRKFQLNKKKLLLVLSILRKR